MVAMVTKQKIFDQLYLYETFKDEPIPHKNFTFLHQGSYEIPGGGGGVGPTPMVSDVGPKPLVLNLMKIIRMDQLADRPIVTFRDQRVGPTPMVSDVGPKPLVLNLMKIIRMDQLADRPIVTFRDQPILFELCLEAKISLSKR